ncbi:DUF6151 family protein [Psychrosphaera aquimarina]|uniref:DUF6151 family protein n=1 Tax=Psychrosphaera aquimarina TaxID=2044854 RepID=A0ABU3R588_9GAMM|nr:DUF6151 family protein [Psychrosphaera aquimarina]MDU0114642.1 DUF6151 family protein [Psychrosphaera aquimarina]
MSNIVPLECSCKAVKGQLKIVPGSFFHVQCLCCDCQSFAAHLNNKEQILDQHGATELVQTYPAYMKITQGQDKIACVQLNDKGLYRWHTACCNMPLANTMNSSTVPFVGVSVELMKFGNEQEKLELLGPITMKAFGKYSIGEIPKDAHARFPLSYLPKIIAFMLKGMFTHKNRPSPFFNKKIPVTKVNVLP